MTGSESVGQLGGVGGASSRLPLSPVRTDQETSEGEIVALIDNKQDTFYVNNGGNSAWVGTRTSSSGRKFIQTYTDGVWNNNLLALPEY